MKNCDIKGCLGFISEVFAPASMCARWLELRACQCGAWDHAKGPRACTCNPPEGTKVPTQYWPNLDWFILGGVEKVTLCPRHKLEVMGEIVRQRHLDPSMDPGDKPNPGNRH